MAVEVNGPSTIQHSIWCTLHKLRVKNIQQAWATFAAKVPLEVREEEVLTLQIVLDRMLKSMIASQVKQNAQNESPKQLTLEESNAYGRLCCCPSSEAVQENNQKQSIPEEETFQCL